MTMLNNFNKFILFFVIILQTYVIHSGDTELTLSHDNRIRTYIYNKNEVYLLPLTFGFQASIEFAKKEDIKTILLGDTYAWKITPMENRLSIKALEKNIRTNMTIITNKRTYYFDLIAKDNSDDLFSHENMVYVVRFFYPK
jgi:type IV secretion system protein VirB9